MKRLVGIVLFVFVLTWDLVTDLAKWRGGVAVNHTLEAVIRFGLLLPSLFFLSGFGVLFGPLRIGVPDKWFWKTLSAGLLMASVYWIAFDSCYNFFRGFPMFFNGGVDYNDGFLDKFLRKMEDWQEALLKVGLVIGSVVIYLRVRDEKV